MSCAQKLCVAGFGQKTSLWLSVYRGQLTEATVEEPKSHEHIEIDDGFADHFRFFPVNPKHGPKTTTVCPYLTLQAGKKAASAIRDYSASLLARALITHYGWQIANGAKPLPEKGALAQVYAGNVAVYLYAKRVGKDSNAPPAKSAVAN